MLEVGKIKVSYNKVEVLKDISFTVSRGERIVIVGESGCGKTTLLKTLSGHIQIDSGQILVDNVSLKGPNEQLVPGHSKIKLVNQDFNLENFHTVTENIRLKLLRFDTEYITYRIKTLLKVTGLEKYSNHLAKNLSGGQKQRLAIARALADEPELLLLDEPFNQLDYFLRQKIENYIDDYLKQQNITLMLVSHNGEETMRWGEKVMFLNNGKIERIASPIDFYENPKNRKQAGFFGVVNTVFIEKKYVSFRPNQFSLDANKLYPIELFVKLDKIVNKGWYFDHLLKYGRKTIHLYSSSKMCINKSIFVQPLF